MLVQKDSRVQSSSSQSFARLPALIVNLTPPIKGAIAFNIPDETLYFADGEVWKPVSSGSSTSVVMDDIATGDKFPTTTLDGVWYGNGSKSSVSGITDTIIGNDNVFLPGASRTIYGYSNTISNDSVVAIGHLNVVSGNGAAAFGQGCTASGTSSLSIGKSAVSGGLESISIGISSVSNGNYSLAVGSGATTSTSQFATAVGRNASVTALAGAAFGAFASVSAQYGVALGESSQVLGDYGIAIGSSGYAAGRDSVSICRNSSSTGISGISLGFNAVTNKDYAVALGDNATGNGLNGLALGRNSKTGTGDNNTSVGCNAGANSTTGNRNVLIGYNAGTDGVANITTQSDTIVLGHQNITNAYIQVPWTVVSDQRDKTDIKPSLYGLNFVNKLNPVSFKMQPRGTELDQDARAHAQSRIGFIAQDIETLDYEKLIVDSSNPDHLKIRETALIPVLTRAIQELAAENRLIRDQIQALMA